MTIVSFNFDGYELVPIDCSLHTSPFITICNYVRLSKKALVVLDNPSCVVLEYNNNNRVLSIRKYDIEDHQLQSDLIHSNSTLTVGFITDSRYIVRISAFRNMLKGQLKGNNRFRVFGETDCQGLVFRLDNAEPFFIQTHQT